MMNILGRFFSYAVIFLASLETESLMEAFYRSWGRPKGKKFAKSIIDTFHVAEWQTPSGIFAGETPAFEVSNTRIKRAYGRIARRLFFHEHGIRLPDEYVTEVRPWVEEDSSLLQEIPRMFGNQSIYSIGDTVFKYTWITAKDNPYASIWLLQFYRRALVLVRSIPRAVAHRNG
jgi:hypothetical protein